jgi:deoxycytidylate deaminase
VYYKAKNKAMENGEQFHLVAILYRNKSVVRMATNSQKTSPRFERTYSNGKKGFCLHAEMDVLRFAKPGDELVVYRFSAKGVITCGKPCKFCSQFIIDSGIKKVSYTDWGGEMKVIKYKKQKRA